MEDIYDDLENFNDVNVVNELRAENEELKQKLGQYAESMASLQKDFDNLSTELKKLETNYSSLLKSARAEIKRKTDMIKNLNIEKDMLVLKQFQDKPDHRQKLLSGCKVKAERFVKNTKNLNKVVDLQQREEFRKSPSENSSTSTEKSLNTGNRGADGVNATGRNMSKENESQNLAIPTHRENCHDDRLQGGKIADKRISTLTSQPFLKFSSDEEFEDMYSALEPKTISKGSSFGNESQKGQKRVREEPPPRTYNESSGPQDKRLNYSDTPRDRFNRNRNRRFYENDRNINRDKHDLTHPYRSKYSPDRARYSKRDFGDDRLLQQYDRPRWMENASGERYQHKRRERRPYPDRGRSDQNPDMDRNNYSDTYTGKYTLASSTQIHGDYDPPPIKRFRGDQYPHTEEDRRRNDRQFPQEHEYHPSESRETYRHTEINDELVSNIYADLDKPTSDSAVLPANSNNIRDNQDTNHDTGISMDKQAGKHGSQCTKKDNLKDDLRSRHIEEKNLKYKIPLKGHKVNTDELSNTKSNTTNVVAKIADQVYSGGNSRSKLQQKDLTSVNDSFKKSDVAKTESSKLTSNIDSKSLVAKISNRNETEVNTSFECVLEQKLSSIRNIVEGDLALSDETNDDTKVQLKEDEPDTKKKHKTKKKSRKDISKDKIPTRKTRSKTDKDKDVRAKNKFSELFGDSSSLISPEDLELAPTPAPKQIAGSYVAVSEDAQDGTPLLDKQNSVRTLAAKKEISGTDPNTIYPQTYLLNLEEKDKTKDTKDNRSRAHHGKRRKSEVLLSDDVKDTKEINSSVTVNSPTAKSVNTTTVTVLEETVSSEGAKEQIYVNKPETKVKGDVLERPLIPEVKIAGSNKKCKDMNKLDKKARGDDIAKLLMPELNTVAASDKPTKINSNKPDHIAKGGTDEIQVVPSMAEECTEIFNIPKPNQKGKGDVVETHLLPELNVVPLVEKSKEILNTSKPDKKSESNVPQTHFMSEVKAVASSEKPKEVYNITKLVKKTKVPEVSTVESSKTSDESMNMSKTANEKNPIVVTPLMSEVKPVVSREKSKEIRNVAKPEKKAKGALKYDEKNKDHTKSNKKPKSNEDKIVPSNEVEKDSHITKNRGIAELNIPAIKSSNKENESFGEFSEGTLNNELPKFFEETLVPIENISFDKNKTDEEKPTVNKVPKEIVSNTNIEDTPNLEAVTEDPGLVNTVVISSGIQPQSENVLEYNTTESQYSLKALATSTPSRELPTLTTPSEIKPYANNLTDSVNAETANENPVPNNDESDIPDVRIYCYRRRRKLVK